MDQILQAIPGLSTAVNFVAVLVIALDWAAYKRRH